MKIEQLKEKVGMDDLLGFYGAHFERPRNGWFSIACVFHDDRNMSAGVNFIKNRFKCHAATCGVSGDIIDVVKEVEGFSDNKAAVEFIERRFRL